MEEAGYVVIGGGAFGASTAYHLARRGAGRVVLLDRYAIGSQTSPRAAGQANKLASTELAARLVDEAIGHLASFEAESGHPLNWHRSGSLRAALTPEGVARLEADVERLLGLGYAAEMVPNAEAARLAPHFKPGRALAIVYCPDDGWLDPEKLAPGYVARAVAAGADVRPNTPVLEVLRKDGQVSGVRTPHGEIRAPVVVDAAGAWARLVAEVAGIRVAMVPTRHQLYITEPIEGLEPHSPIVRLFEPSVYVRYEQGGLLVGGFEDEPLTFAHTLPDDYTVDQLPLDLSVLRAMTDEVLEFLPALRDARIRQHRGGLPTTTPDGQFIVGPVPNLGGFYIISGCNAGGLSVSPALGRALADLIVDGRTDPDLRPYYVERFGGRIEDEQELAAACRYKFARKYTK